MTKANQNTTTGAIPDSIRERIASVVHDYDSARHLVLEALQAFGAILAEASSSYKAWGFASESSVREAIGVQVTDHLQSASPEAVRNFISMARSQYALASLAPEVVARDDYSREVLKALAPVVNRDNAAKVLPKVLKQADSLVSEGKATSLAKGIREARIAIESPKSRVPSWFTDLRNAATTLAGKLAIVKRGKDDAMLTVESLESAIGFVADVATHTDPRTLQTTNATDGWTVKRINAMRAEVHRLDRLIDTVEVQYRKDAGLQPMKQAK